MKLTLFAFLWVAVICDIRHDCGGYSRGCCWRIRFYSIDLSSRIGATLTCLTAVGLGAGVFLVVVMKSRIMAEKEWYLLPSEKDWPVFNYVLLKIEGDCMNILTIIG